ncbi:MAG: hypothetical protein Q7S22_00775, partial [Candidatus Micrarchaeota archaeon]|nr:hypothetical protein [Candidatus Micrarchaeota archaeon]
MTRIVLDFRPKLDSDPLIIHPAAKRNHRPNVFTRMNPVLGDAHLMESFGANVAAWSEKLSRLRTMPVETAVSLLKEVILKRGKDRYEEDVLKETRIQADSVLAEVIDDAVERGPVSKTVRETLRELARELIKLGAD